MEDCNLVYKYPWILNEPEFGLILQKSSQQKARHKEKATFFENVRIRSLMDLKYFITEILKSILFVWAGNLIFQCRLHYFPQNINLKENY